MVKNMYKSFEIKVDKISKDAYNWEIYGKNPLDKKPFMMREGIAYVETKKQVLEIAKEVIDEELL